MYENCKNLNYGFWFFSTLPQRIYKCLQESSRLTVYYSSRSALKMLSTAWNEGWLNIHWNFDGNAIHCIPASTVYLFDVRLFIIVVLNAIDGVFETVLRSWLFYSRRIDVVDYKCNGSGVWPVWIMAIWWAAMLVARVSSGAWFHW